MHNTGHCHCGAVHFEVEGAPLRMVQCHCNACRRLSGTGHLVQAMFRRDQITITGETRTHQSMSDAGNLRTRHFCPTCGSRLFSENTKSPDAMGIAVGTFDESSWFKPDVIVYGKERPVWDPIDPEIEIHDLM